MAETWLTYAQAGERFSTSAEAVRLRARRLGWRTQPGNDGRTLVAVPDDVDVQPRPRPPVQSGVQSVGQPEIARLAGLLAVADARADQAEKRAMRRFYALMQPMPIDAQLMRGPMPSAPELTGRSRAGTLSAVV